MASTDRKYDKYQYGVAYWDRAQMMFFGYTEGHYSYFDDPVARDVLRTSDEMEIDRALRYAVKDYEAGRIQKPFPVLIHVQCSPADASALDRIIIEKRRRAALAKLTPEEKAVLGLED